MPDKINIGQIMSSPKKSKDLFEQAAFYAYDYMENIDSRPVYPLDNDLENLSVFDEPFPESMGDAKNILQLLHEYGSKACVAQTGNRYFGFVNGGVTPVALASKWLSDVWDQNAAMFVTSPIASCLESVCEKWLVNLFGLPEETVAGFVSGTSAASMCGLVAARNQLFKNMDWDIEKKGMFCAPKLRVVLGEQAHSTIFKALSLIGFGLEDIERVPVDDQGRMIVSKIPDLDDKTIVIVQAGNVNTGSFDSFNEICDRAIKVNAWVHVDGAFGLWAAGSESKRHLISGIEKADSWSVDAHKTLNAPYDCGIIFCRHEKAMVSALQNTGAYIQYGDKRDGMRYTPEMSRRARSVELWATLKFFGKKGVECLVDDLCEKARLFAIQLEQHRFTILNDVVFNQVLLSCDDEALTLAVLHNIQSDRTCWCGGSSWNGKAAIRISVCSFATTKEDITNCVEVFVNARKKALEKL